MAEVVQRLIGHPTGESTIPDHRHDVTGTTCRVVLVLETESRGNTVRITESRRCMGVLDPVMDGLRPRWVAREPTFLLQADEAVTAPRQDLVDIGLVPGVEQEDVLRGVEDPVQGECELDDTEVRTEVPTGTRNGRYDEVADLRRELFALDERKGLEIGG